MNADRCRVILDPANVDLRMYLLRKLFDGSYFSASKEEPRSHNTKSPREKILSRSIKLIKLISLSRSNGGTQQLDTFITERATQILEPLVFQKDNAPTLIRFLLNPFDPTLPNQAELESYIRAEIETFLAFGLSNTQILISVADWNHAAFHFYRERFTHSFAPDTWTPAFLRVLIITYNTRFRTRNLRVIEELLVNPYDRNLYWYNVSYNSSELPVDPKTHLRPILEKTTSQMKTCMTHQLGVRAKIMCLHSYITAVSSRCIPSKELTALSQLAKPTTKVVNFSRNECERVDELFVRLQRFTTTINTVHLHSWLAKVSQNNLQVATQCYQEVTAVTTRYLLKWLLDICSSTNSAQSSKNLLAILDDNDKISQEQFDNQFAKPLSIPDLYKLEGISWIHTILADPRPVLWIPNAEPYKNAVESFKRRIIPPILDIFQLHKDPRLQENLSDALSTKWYKKTVSYITHEHISGITLKIRNNPKTLQFYWIIDESLNGTTHELSICLYSVATHQVQIISLSPHGRSIYMDAVGGAIENAYSTTTTISAKRGSPQTLDAFVTNIDYFRREFGLESNLFTLECAIWLIDAIISLDDQRVAIMGNTLPNLYGYIVTEYREGLIASITS